MKPTTNRTRMNIPRWKLKIVLIQQDYAYVIQNGINL